MLIFRRSEYRDVEAMVTIAEEGRALLKARGIAQWQRGTYPDRALFLRDAAEGIGYVVTEEETVAAICAVTFTEEAAYNTLRQGAWLLEEGRPYATIHRGAVGAAFRRQQVSQFLFQSVAELARANGMGSVRADTHPDNLSMQGALIKAGFRKTGEFHILEGDEAGDLRWGYELLL